MKKILSAFVLALVVVVFAGCGKKEEPTVDSIKKDATTLEEKAGDQAKEALKTAPAVPAIPKDHPAH